MADYKDIVGTAVRNNAGDLTSAKTGELFYDSTNLNFIYKNPNVTTAGAWRTGNDMNATKYTLGANGTQTAAIGFGTTAITLPSADGSADQVLTTDGSGTLSFVDNTGGTSWVAVKTSNYTASAGEGVFANTTGGAWTLTLPAGTIGDEVSFIDYAGTFDTNNLTIAANGSEKIVGSTDDLTVSVERAANTLVFTDGTQGWLLKSK